MQNFFQKKLTAKKKFDIMSTDQGRTPKGGNKMYKVYREFEDMFGYDEVCMGEYGTEAEAEQALKMFEQDEIEEFGEVMDTYYIEKEE